MRDFSVLYTLVLCIWCGRASSGSAQIKTLDFESPNDAYCRTFETSIDCIPSKVYDIKRGEKVQRITCGEYTIWKTSKDNVQCLYGISFLRDNEPKIILLKILKKDKPAYRFYKYKDEDGRCGCCLFNAINFLKLECFRTEGWHKSKNGYKNELPTLHTNIAPVADFTLSVTTDLDSDYFKVRNYRKDRGHYRYYAPKDGYKAKKIVDGSYEIWNGGKEQVCYLCEYYSIGKDALVRLHIKKSDFKILLGYYVRNGNEWKEVDDKRFVELLTRSLKGKSDNGNGTPDSPIKDVEDVDTRDYDNFHSTIEGFGNIPTPLSRENQR